MNDGLLSDDELFGDQIELLPDEAIFGSQSLFEGEGAARLTARRGQQFAVGLTETIAAVPEALAVAGAASDARRVSGADVSDARAESYETELDQIGSRIREIEAALGLNGNPRPSRENRLDADRRSALEAEYAQLAARRNQLDLAVGSGGLEAYRADAQARRESALVDGRVVPANERDIFGYGDAIRRGSADIFGEPDPRDQSFWGKLAGGAGSMAGMVGTTLATTAIAGPVAGVTVGAAQGSALNSSAIYREAIAAGVDEEVAREAAGYAALAGASEVIPITRALNLLPPRLRVQAKNAFMQRIVRIARSSGEEAIQEGLVEIANNLIAQNYYDPERGWNEDVTEAMLIGAILGGGLGVGGTVRMRTANEPPPGEDVPSNVNTGEISPDQTAALAGVDVPTSEALDGAPSEVAPDQAAALETTTPLPVAVTSTFLEGEAAALAAPQPAPQPAPEAALPPEVTPAPQPAPAQPAPQPAPVQPEMSPEQAGDTLDTVPEAPSTIEQQTADLLDPNNRRAAVFIPNDTFEAGGIEAPFGRNIRPVVLPEGVVYVNTAKGYGPGAVMTLYRSGRLGQVLGLGPFNKAEVAESVAQGNPEVAVVERTPDGVEVRAAAGTTETAPQQMAALQADAAPGNTVAVEDPAAVLADRVSAREGEGDQPSAAAQAAAELAEAQQEQQQRRFEVETRRRRVGPEATRALEQARQRREGRLSLTPKSEAPVTSEGNQPDAGAPPRFEAGEALWQGPEADLPVVVLDAPPQLGPDGLWYQPVSDPETSRQTFVPFDQLTARPKKPNTKPTTKETANEGSGKTAARDQRAGDGGAGYSAGELAPLPGAPNAEGASGPDAQLVAVAEQYAAENGIDLKRQATFAEVDPERGARIAQAYEAMEHAPQDPVVREAYQNLIDQTMAQYRALEAAGYEFTFFDDSTDPYQGNPWNAMRDLRQNKRMAVYGTYAGYGTEGITTGAVDDNPMLVDTGLRWMDQNGQPQIVTANDLFRAVHDAFGHGLEGAGFRARGEENAWQAHVRLFTGSAVAAITSETRGQNSWLNFGPYGDFNRNASVEDTVFAEQKTGLMPEWTWTEGRVGDMQVTQQGNEAAPEAPSEPKPASKADKAKQTSKQRGGARARRKGVAAVEAAGERKETRDEGYEAVNERVKRGELNHVDEARARARVAGLSAERAAPKIEQARIAGEIFDKNVPDELIQVNDKPGKAALRDRLASAVNEATERGFEFTARPNFPTNANAVVWLNQAKMMLGKLRSDKASYDEIQRFLLDEHAIKSANDGDLLRQTRKEVGEQVMAPTGGTGDVGQIAAPVAERADPDALEAADAAAVESQSEFEVEDSDRASAATKVDDDGNLDLGSALGLMSQDDADIGARVTMSRRGARLDAGTEKGGVRFKAGKGKTIEREVERAKAASEARTLKEDEAAIAAALESLNKIREREEAKRQAQEAGRGVAPAPKAEAAKETSQARAPKESAKAKEVAERRQAETQAAAEARKAELDDAKKAASERRKREIEDANAWLAQNRDKLKSEVTSEGDDVVRKERQHSRGKPGVRSVRAKALDLANLSEVSVLTRSVGWWQNEFKRRSEDIGLDPANYLFGSITGRPSRDEKTRRAISKIASSMMDQIVGSIRSTKVYVLPDAVIDADPSMGSKTGAAYWAAGDAIIIRESTFDAAEAGDGSGLIADITHEATHAAFLHAIKINPRLKAEIDALRKAVIAHARRVKWQGNRYGLKNADEFIAEAWSNPEFMEFLSKVPLPESMDASIQEMRAYFGGGTAPRIDRALAWIKGKVAQIFGFKKAALKFGIKPGKTMFDAAMDVSDVLVGLSSQARGEYYSYIDAATDSGLDLNQAAASLDTVQDRDGNILTLSRRRETQRELRDPVAKKLNDLGVEPRDAAMAAETIAADPRFAGKITDAQLAALADALKKARELSPNEQKKIEQAHKKLNAHFNKQRAAAIAHTGKMEAETMEALRNDFVPSRKPANPIRRLLKLTSNFQLAEISERFFGKENNPVRDYALLVEERRLLRDKLAREGMELTQRLAEAQGKHTREEWEQFSDFIIDVTSSNAHPDVPLTHERNKHISKGDPKDPTKGMADAWKRTEHARLAQHWAGMPDSLKQLYTEARDNFTDLQNRISLQLTENVLEAVGMPNKAMAKRIHEGNETQEDRDALGPQIMTHIENVSELKKLNGPYFPLTRRGNFLVRGTYELDVPAGARKVAPDQIEFKTPEEAVAYSTKLGHRNTVQTVYVDKDTGSRFGIEKDGTEVRVSDKDGEARYVVTVQNNHVEFFDTEREARQRHAELSENASLKLKDVTERRFDGVRPNAELASSQMRMLAATIDANAEKSGMNPKQIEALKATLNEVSLRFLGSTRLQSHRLPRAYVQGASRDVARNTMDYTQSAAGYLARLETGPRMEKTMRMLEQRTSIIEDRGTDSGLGARMIANEIVSREEGSFHTGESWWSQQTSRLVAASYVNYLASPGYSFVNATQVPVLALPVLTGEFGLARSSYHLTKAYKDVGALRIVGGGVGDTIRAALPKRLGGSKAKSERFIEDIISRASKGEAQMLRTLVGEGLVDAQGGIDVERTMRRKGVGGAVIDAPLGYLEDITRALPQGIEAINRTVTALAAYRLHFSKHKDHDAATRYASEAVHQSQGLYSNSNQAPMFSNTIGRLPLQFMKYPQLVFYIYGKNMGRVLRPMEKGERIKGIRTLAALTATHGFFAGLAGATFWEVAKIPLMIFKGLGLTDLTWEDFEDEVEEVTARLTGSDFLAEILTFGAPRAVGVDLSSRIGLQNMLFFGEPRSNDREGWMSYLANVAAGAPGNMAADAFVGVRAAIDGDYYRAAERLAPAKVLADLVRASNQFTAGRYNEQEFVLRTFGLMPARHASVSREIGRDIRESRGRRDERISLEREWLRARTPEQVARATSRIRAYNNRLGDGQPGISIEALRRRRAQQAQQWNR